jgi:hypothetical protein
MNHLKAFLCRSLVHSDYWLKAILNVSNMGKKIDLNKTIQLYKNILWNLSELPLKVFTAELHDSGLGGSCHGFLSLGGRFTVFEIEA